MIIDGRKIAAQIKERLKAEVAALSFQPVFCDILVGDNAVSAQYVAMKGKAAQEVGIRFERADLPGGATTEQVIETIERLNREPHMSGLIVQLPLPSHIDRKKVLDAIDPRIDVDSTGEANTTLFYDGKGALVFPTAAAVMELLDSTGVNLTGKNILMVGQGALVGRPVTFLLRQRGLNVTTADIDTKDVPGLIRQADVVISATGQGKMIKGDMIKPGAIIIDAGTSESDSGIVGDVDFDSVAPVASFLSPVPGGVGPVTVAKLLENVVKVARNTRL
jgi:methylenetetrahydrofolate dehydrogenase (NADP+)/methenyltetrahydrofolate cyclohydrolase